ncbi:MAG TPA: MFS transporter [Terriglobales bacterium]
MNEPELHSEQAVGAIEASALKGAAANAEDGATSSLVQAPPGSALGMSETASEELFADQQGLGRMLLALRHRDFRYFWTGNFLSNIGTWMQNVAQGWLVLKLSNSPFWLGMIGFASSAPMLIFTLFGGVIADRVNKRRLLIWTQSAMMVFAFIMAALVYMKVIAIWQLVVLVFLTGVAMALNTPSYQALVPMLVPGEDLANAIALNSAQFNMSRVLGPTLGGFAMAWIGIAGNFFLNALSFLAVIIALMQIHYPEEPRRRESSMWETLLEGFRYSFSFPEMRDLVILISATSLLAVPYITFIPLFARDILHVGERGLGLLMAWSGMGAFLGAATIAYFGRARRRGKTVIISGCVFFASVVLFCVSTRFWISGLLQAISGYSMIVMVANINTLLQELSTDEMRGRVMGIYATAFLGFAPIGSLLAGSFGNLLSAPLAIAAMNVLAIVVFLVVYYISPALRELN